MVIVFQSSVWLSSKEVDGSVQVGQERDREVWWPALLACIRVKLHEGDNFFQRYSLRRSRRLDEHASCVAMRVRAID